MALGLIEGSSIDICGRRICRRLQQMVEVTVEATEGCFGAKRPVLMLLWCMFSLYLCSVDIQTWFLLLYYLLLDSLRGGCDKLYYISGSTWCICTLTLLWVINKREVATYKLLNLLLLQAKECADFKQFKSSRSPVTCYFFPLWYSVFQNVELLGLHRAKLWPFFLVLNVQQGGYTEE